MNNQRLSKDFLMLEYEKFKNKSLVYFTNGKFNKSLKTARFAARTAYHFPILYNFIDEELESTLSKISDQVLKDFKNQQDKYDERRIIFYTSRIIDSGLLTEQFLSFFTENNYHVLFIIPDKKTLSSGKRILKTISENPNFEIYIQEKGNDIERIAQIYNKVISFSASKAFLQFTPEDVIGFCVFLNIKILKKYFLDITNQSFGLGKLCSDFYVEIWKVGVLMAIERRKIDLSKIIFLPVYPIVDNNIFKGFPFDRKNKIVGLSGGQLYKYLADPELKYFHVVKNLLENNTNFIFCLAGSGSDPKLIIDFIKKYKLEDRFVLLGQRNDFYELVKNADVFFESYPMKFGLTPIFAIENKIPIAGIANRNNVSGGIEDAMNMTNFKQVESFDDFYIEAEKLIRSETERKKNVNLFQECKYSKKYFDLELGNILNDKQTSINIFRTENLIYNDAEALKEYLSNIDVYSNYYLEKVYFIWNCISIRELFDALIKIKFKFLLNMIFK